MIGVCANHPLTYVRCSHSHCDVHLACAQGLHGPGKWFNSVQDTRILEAVLAQYLQGATAN